MHDHTPRSRAIRSRATQRLRNLTIGTTMAGLAASAGFGVLAAATFDGNSATPSATDSAITSSDSSIAAPALTDESNETNESNDSATSATPAPVVSSTTGVTRSSRRSHVTTGSS